MLNYNWSDFGKPWITRPTEGIHYTGKSCICICMIYSTSIACDVFKSILLLKIYAQEKVKPMKMKMTAQWFASTFTFDARFSVSPLRSCSCGNYRKHSAETVQKMAWIFHWVTCCNRCNPYTDESILLLFVEKILFWYTEENACNSIINQAVRFIMFSFYSLSKPAFYFLSKIAREKEERSRFYCYWW